MRTFHVFSIDKSIVNLVKDEPYQLFYTFQKINTLNKNDFSLGINLYEQVANPFDKEKINKRIFKYYDESDFYFKIKNNHTYINKYRSEESYLDVHNAYLKIKSNLSNPDFFKVLKKDPNLFICDFENFDYFWARNI